MGLFYAMVTRKSARRQGSDSSRQSQASRLGFPGWSSLRRRGHDDHGNSTSEANFLPAVIARDYQMLPGSLSQ